MHKHCVTGVALPIDSVIPELLAALAEHPAVVLVAEPGAGKTTRVPVALEQFLDATPPRRRVLISEPRRVAARLAAARVSEELAVPLGERVGYSVRFERKASSRTSLLFQTEGVLLRELLQPRSFVDVKAVILDEFHERHLETDLLLALLRERIATGEMRLVIMSATLDEKEVSAFLDNCPVVRSRGRAHPLTIRYDDSLADRPLERSVAAAVRTELQTRPTGNVLVFLPGTRAITNTRNALGGTVGNVELVPLHGQLTLEEQRRALAPSTERKVVLATNLAESSVTVAGVSSVVDSGLEHRAFDSPWGGQRRLELVPISRHSADQRAGRAGRLGPGHVVRLYSEADYRRRQEADAPEVCRLDLTAFLLDVASAGRSAAELRWLTPPPAAALQRAETLLAALGALEEGRITPLGRRMQALPIPPRPARVALQLATQGRPALGARAAALLAERDILLPQGSAAERGDSDLQVRLDALLEAEAASHPSAWRHIGLDGRATRDVLKLVQQLDRQLTSLPPTTLPTPIAWADDDDSDEVALRKALLVAYRDRVAQRRKTQRRDFTLCDGIGGRQDDGSVVFDASLAIALESHQQSNSGQLWLTSLSAIEADWLLESAQGGIEARDRLEFNREKGRVDHIEQLAFGSIVLEEVRGVAPPGPARTALLLEAARSRQAALFGRTGGTHAVLARLQFFATQTQAALAVPTDLPALLELGCDDCSSLDELSALNWEQLAVSALSYEQRAQLDEVAPLFIQLPNARRLSVHYEMDKAPWVASRIQDFFGLATGPTLGPRRIPLTLHLLAPNGRAAQVTQDLAGFWERHYPEVRGELRRRYAKHYWPEDGRNAPPAPPRGRPRQS